MYCIINVCCNLQKLMINCDPPPILLLHSCKKMLASYLKNLENVDIGRLTVHLPSTSWHYTVHELCITGAVLKN